LFRRTPRARMASRTVSPGSDRAAEM
jgi:hypothetical protein